MNLLHVRGIFNQIERIEARNSVFVTYVLTRALMTYTIKIIFRFFVIQLMRDGVYLVIQCRRRRRFHPRINMMNDDWAMNEETKQKKNIKKII